MNDVNSHARASSQSCNDHGDWLLDDRAIMWNITQQQIMELRQLNMSVTYTK